MVANPLRRGYNRAVFLVRFPSVCLTLALVGVVAMCGCKDSPDNAGPSTDGLERGVVVLETGARTLRVSVEVVRSDEDRARGLMFRKSLPAQAGMFFVFDRQEVQSFWMQNTYIPLDMIFIDKDLTVVGAVQNAEPMTTTRRSVISPSTYVLEVNAGYVEEHGIKRGAKVKVEGFSPKTP